MSDNGIFAEREVSELEIHTRGARSDHASRPVGRTSVFRGVGLLVAATTFVALSLAGAREAHGRDGFFLDDDAAMASGAVTASTRGSGGAWYNPAGLGGVVRDSIDISGSAFALRFLGADDFLQVSLDDNEGGEDVYFVSFVSVPTVLNFVRQLDDEMSIALAVYVRDFVDIEFRTSTTTSSVHPDTGEETEARLGVSVSFLAADQVAGFAWGWQVDEAVRIGASFFAGYSSTRFAVSTRVARITGDDGQPRDGDFIAITESAGVERYVSGQLAFGVQWDMASWATLGVMLRSPTMAILELNDVDTEIAQGGLLETPNFGFTSLSDNRKEGIFEMVEALRAHLGVVFRTDDGWVEVDVDVRPPFTHGLDGHDADTVVNGRIGGGWSASDDLRLGAGAYTDFADHRTPTRFGDMPVDWFGATFGLEFDNDFVVGDPDDAETEATDVSAMEDAREERTIRFSTTVALRYALGVGKVGGLRFVSQTLPAVTEVTALPVVFHEVALHIGTSVRF